jgi:rare lipoprotein A
MPTQPASEPAPRFAPEAISQLAPVAAPQPMPAIDQRGYFLQAGSFADLGNAHAFRDKLRDLGPVSVTAVQVNGAEYYRVMVGPWASRTEAERAQGRLIEAGTKAIVIARLD